MAEKKSQTSLNQDQLETSPDFLSLESRVFLQKGNDIYIGKVLATEQMRSLLKDQAENFKTSNLFEIINATIIQEASDLALLQSGKSGSIEDDVRFAKALHHVNHVITNMINALSK